MIDKFYVDATVPSEKHASHMHRINEWLAKYARSHVYACVDLDKKNTRGIRLAFEVNTPKRMYDVKKGFTAILGSSACFVVRRAIDSDYESIGSTTAHGVHNFGSEYLAFIEEGYFVGLFMRGYIGLKEAIERVFFDDGHPENQTVRIQSHRMMTAEMMVGGAWKLVDMNVAMDRVIRQVYNCISTRYLADEKYRRGLLDECLMTDIDSCWLTNPVMWSMAVMGMNHELTARLRHDVMFMFLNKRMRDQARRAV